MSDNEELKPQMLYTVNDAASMLPISRAHLYQLMSRNDKIFEDRAVDAVYSKATN